MSQIASSPVVSITQLTCEKCQTPGAVRPGMIRAYPTAVVIFGYVLWVPAAVFLGLTVIGMVSASMSTGTVSASTGFIMSAGVVVVFLITIPFLAIGMFLTRKRKMWRCQACAYAYERA